MAHYDLVRPPPVPAGGYHARRLARRAFDTQLPRRRRAARRAWFRLAKFEGDAAFVYALADKVDGPLMQDSIERPILRSAGGSTTSSRPIVVSAKPVAG